MSSRPTTRRPAILPALALFLLTIQNSHAEGLPLEGALASLEPEWQAILSDPRHDVALRYTRIDRDAEGTPRFEILDFGKDTYFYPASTVKLPAVLLALEALDTDTFRANEITADSPVRSIANRTTSVRGALREILLVSDNDAFNILFDLVGANALSEGMETRGYSGTRIFHRLAGRETGREIPAGPLTFLSHDETILAVVPLPPDGDSFMATQPIPKGMAHLSGGQRIEEPFDFARHNAYPLAAQQETLRALVFPESVAESARFRLTPGYRALVLRAMAEFPTESDDPALDPGEFPAGYARFFISDQMGEPLPGLRSFGKSGQAYGTTTDNAYIVDRAHDVEFLLAATLYTNANGTLNDNIYEYREIAEPFLHAVCRAILEYERARKRAYPPDFREVRDFLPAESSKR